MPLALIVRHGQAAGNTEHRFIGQSDVPLDDLGRAQARALAARLAHLPIVRIISSDLARSVDTITPIAEHIGLRVETDPRLREINNGEWSGLLPAEIAGRWPDLWEAYIGGDDVERPGGETWAEVRARTLSAISELAATEGTVLVCTHGGPALNLARWALGIPPGGNIFRGSLGAVANTSITTIELAGPRLISFNDIGHLSSEAHDLRLAFDPIE
ncbi:MAG TPA: histidine phosphatase family protein [Acidimicrobiia bacterium]|nr:histidine phosphatase family protein [Acidimicrobiia bacterium]